MASPDKNSNGVNRQERPQNSLKKGLYIKIPAKESEAYKRANILLSIFEGNFPVYFFFDDQRKLMLAPREYWVDINDVLVKELKNKLGNNNIIVK